MRPSVATFLVLHVFLACGASARVMIPPHVVIPDARFVDVQCNGIRQLAVPRKSLDADESGALTTLERMCTRRPTSDTADNWAKFFGDTLNKLDRSLFAPGRGPIFNAKTLPTEYRTYTIFLVPDATWATNQRAAELATLHQVFRNFGDAIGQSEAAIWLWLPNSARVDVLRSKDYCDKWKLNYNDGPYVVTTMIRPDRVTAADDKLVIKLGGVSPARVARVLNVLEADLRRRLEPRRGNVLYEEVKQALFSAFDQHRDTIVEIGVTLLK